MHICDSRACYYPPHLRAGTQAENMQDAAAKGRVKTGAKPDDIPCVNGHVGEIVRTSKGRRVCRACNRADKRARTRRKAAAEGRELGYNGRRDDDYPCPRGHTGQFVRTPNGRRCQECRRQDAAASRLATRLRNKLIPNR